MTYVKICMVVDRVMASPQNVLPVILGILYDKRDLADVIKVKDLEVESVPQFSEWAQTNCLSL